jgi:hypothetical protein
MYILTKFRPYRESPNESKIALILMSDHFDDSAPHLAATYESLAAGRNTYGISTEVPMAYAISLYDVLVSINVPKPQALAVVESLEQTMTSELATKTDLAQLRHHTDREFALLREEMKSAVSRGVIMTTGLMIAWTSLLFAGFQFLG